MKETAKNLILLVEDDLSIRKDLCSLLEGYEVFSAEHGQAAVSILDIMMPVMDGWKFREAQLQMQEVSAIPAVVMTADGQAAEKATKMKVQGFIQKPTQSSESFLKTVNRFSRVV